MAQASLRKCVDSSEPSLLIEQSMDVDENSGQNLDL